MMLIGSSIKIAPVVEWDGQPIGSGKPGPIAKKLLQLCHDPLSAQGEGRLEQLARLHREELRSVQAGFSVPGVTPSGTASPRGSEAIA